MSSRSAEYVTTHLTNLKNAFSTLYLLVQALWKYRIDNFSDASLSSLASSTGSWHLHTLTYKHLSGCSHELPKWPAGMDTFPGTSASPVSLSHFRTPLLSICYSLFYD